MLINDIGYGEYKSVKDYVDEPSRVKELRGMIRAKKQMIQMMNRELMELEDALMHEFDKNRDKLDVDDKCIEANMKLDRELHWEKVGEYRG